MTEPVSFASPQLVSGRGLLESERAVYKYEKEHHTHSVGKKEEPSTSMNHLIQGSSKTRISMNHLIEKSASKKSEEPKARMSKATGVTRESLNPYSELSKKHGMKKYA